MSETLTFEVHGDTPEIEWDPYEWIDSSNEEEFKKNLIASAEEQASWGVRLSHRSISDLWKEVEKARKEEE